MTSIDQMVYSQPGLIPEVTGDLTHAIFWSSTVFVDHYSNYYYAHLMRGTLAEENLRTKEFYKSLSDTHRARVCAYRANKRRFSEPLFKEAIQPCGKNISYCRVGSHHHNTIVETGIKELNLCSQIILLHVNILWLESVSTMMWNFSFKAECQRYNRLDTEKDGNTPEHKFEGTDFQFFQQTTTSGFAPSLS